MKMHLYGVTGQSSSRVELKEITVVCDPLTLRELARFINHCANSIESDAGEAWDHEHFSFFLKGAKKHLKSDVVIAHPQLLKKSGKPGAELKD